VTTRTRFSPTKHVPKYSMLMLEVLMTPVVVFFAMTGTGILIVATILFFYFESGVNPEVATYFDSLWWAMATITTVGYGDIVPVTGEGKAIGIALMATGVITFISFTALLVSILFNHTNADILESEVNRESEHLEVLAEMAKLNRRLDNIDSKLNRL